MSQTAYQDFIKQISPIYTDLVNKICDHINAGKADLYKERLEKGEQLVKAEDILQELFEIKSTSFSAKTRKTDTCNWIYDNRSPLRKGQYCDKPSECDKQTGYVFKYCKTHMKSAKGKEYLQKLKEDGEIKTGEISKKEPRTPANNQYEALLHPIAENFFRMKNNNIVLQRDENNQLTAIAVQQIDSNGKIEYRRLADTEKEIASKAKFRILSEQEQIPEIDGNPVEKIEIKDTSQEDTKEDTRESIDIPQISIVDIPKEESDSHSL